MTKEVFNKLSFEEAVSQLQDEGIGTITNIEVLKDFIKEKIDNDDFNVAIHLLEAIWNDPSPEDSYYWDYDYCMGTLDKPTSINSKEDIKHLIED